MTTLQPKHVKQLKRMKRRRQSRSDNRDSNKARHIIGAHGKLNKPKIGIMKPWQRDGHKSELHYLVEHKRFAMKWALKQNFKDHPLYAAAVKAKKLKLI